MDKRNIRFSNYLERLGAFFIDWAVFAFITFLFALVDSEFYFRTIGYLGVLLPFILFIWISSYQLVKNGATLGERLFGLKTLNDSYEKLSPLQALSREIVFILIIFLEFVCFIFYIPSYISSYISPCSRIICPTSIIFMITFILAVNATQLVYDKIFKIYQTGESDFKYPKTFIKLAIAIVISIAMALLALGYMFKGANFHA